MRDEQRLALSKLVDATAAVERAVDAVDGGVAAVRGAVVAMDRNGARWQKVVVTSTIVASIAGAALGVLLTVWLQR